LNSEQTESHNPQLRQGTGKSLTRSSFTVTRRPISCTTRKEARKTTLNSTWKPHGKVDLIKTASNSTACAMKLRNSQHNLKTSII